MDALTNPFVALVADLHKLQNFQSFFLIQSPWTSVTSRSVTELPHVLKLVRLLD